jgi:hypothetical protein
MKTFIRNKMTFHNTSLSCTFALSSEMNGARIALVHSCTYISGKALRRQVCVVMHRDNMKPGAGSRANHSSGRNMGIGGVFVLLFFTHRQWRTGCVPASVTGRPPTWVWGSHSGQSSGIWRHVTRWKFIEVSKKQTASIFSKGKGTSRKLRLPVSLVCPRPKPSKQPEWNNQQIQLCLLCFHPKRYRT